MRRFFALLAFFSFALLSASPGSSGELRADDGALSSLTLLAEAGRAYANGVYEKSVQSYEAAIKAGVLNGDLLLNLGNSHFRQHHLGAALAAYKGALRFLPRDGDVAANLNYLRKLRQDAMEPKLSLFDVAFGWLSWGNRHEFLLLASLVLSLSALTVIAAKVAKRSLPWGAVALLWAASLLSSMAFAAKFFGLNEKEEAVVGLSEVAALSGPSEKNVQLFTLHEGAEVEVTERRAGWTRVVLPDGRSGWIGSAGLVPVLSDAFMVP